MCKKEIYVTFPGLHSEVAYESSSSSFNQPAVTTLSSKAVEGTIGSVGHYAKTFNT